MKNFKLVAMIEAAFFAAFAFILDLLPSIQLAPWISISFAMVPIFIVAFRWGVKGGLLSKRFKLISKPARRRRPYYGLSSLRWLEVWLVTFGTLWQELYSGESMRQKERHPLFIP